MAEKLKKSQAKSPEGGAPVRTPTQQALRRFRKNRIAMLGAVILIVLVVFVIVGPLFAKYDPNANDLFAILKKPSAEHLLGTDSMGRDLLTRLMYGGRISLAIGLATSVFSMAIGSLIGALAGYYGGVTDSLLMRLTDLFLTIPTLPLLMVFGAVFKPSPLLLVVLISVLNWTTTARLVRSKFLTLRTLDYAKAAQAIGAKNSRIILHHLLPNSLGAIIVTATLTVGRAIIMESTLSFLGVGINPPTASWGNMLQSASSTMTRAPLTAIAPGILILLTVLAINFLGDGLDDALDPKREH
ncbi:MAG: ABC transporter permease [Oscillospiraceae bacterium]|nr:ABC transporter permease [Oscillospiraceae bacterium]